MVNHGFVYGYTTKHGYLLPLTVVYHRQYGFPVRLTMVNYGQP